MNDRIRERFLFAARLTNLSPAPAYYDESLHLGWHSPATCLFIAVAAMVGITGLAYLILVCIWCRLGGGNLVNTQQASLEVESVVIKPEVICAPEDMKVLVIMPGDHTPTFVATRHSSAPQNTEL